MKCKKCGSEKRTTIIPCPDGDAGCLVIHSKNECPKCIPEYRINIKPDATLDELIIFLNGMLKGSVSDITMIPDGLDRHFELLE